MKINFNESVNKDTRAYFSQAEHLMMQAKEAMEKGSVEDFGYYIERVTDCLKTIDNVAEYVYNHYSEDEINFELLDNELQRRS